MPGLSLIVIKDAKPVKNPKIANYSGISRKMAGFLEGVNPDDAKLQYLQDKYK
jgi:hypothetical protein